MDKQNNIHVFKAYYFIDFSLSMWPGESIILAPMKANVETLACLMDKPTVAAGIVEIVFEQSSDQMEETITYKVHSCEAFGDFKPRTEKDTTLFEFFIENPNSQIKFIRTIGFNANEDELIFMFSGTGFHDRAAKLLTRGIPRRVRTAGFVKFSSLNVKDFILCGKSDTLGVESQDYDYDEDCLSDTHLAQQQYLN